MKIIAWNVNGLRAIMKTNYLYDMIENEKPSILCLGEIKISTPFIDTHNEIKNKIKQFKYYFWHPSKTRGGYSGTAIFTKKKPVAEHYGLIDDDNKDIDDEGRVICLEYEKFYLVHVYTPNSGASLERLNYRVKTWDPAFRNYIAKLQKKKATIVCGDLNTARNELDICNPKTNLKSAGYTKEERESLEKLLKDASMVDTYRFLNPEKKEYSYWSYRFNSREKNVGWRIDYFLVNEKYIKNVKKSLILTETLGSDHAPVKLDIKL